MARVIPGILLILGLVQGVQGGWIYAKAWLAESLLEGAWSRTLKGEAQVRPWPWADTWLVARLSFPDHGSDMVVLEGASGRVLAFAPGHLHGTASPGQEGACVVAGHRDTHFAVLEHLQPGDLIEVDGTGGSRHSYRVRASAVLDRDDVWALTPTGGSELILVTCWPFDAVVPGGPQRYVVWAAKADTESSDRPTSKRLEQENN